MSDWIKIGDKAIEVCKVYIRSRCDECPIRPKCVNPLVYTREQLNKNISEINEAAEKVKLD